MSRNLRWKWILIITVTLACVLGITGVPKSSEQLAANWRSNIRLGLDLRGGSHIVLQIQLQDAFKAEADLLIDRLKLLLAREKIAYGSVVSNNPEAIEDADKVQVVIVGVPVDRGADFRRIVNESIGSQWAFVSAGADYKLTLRPEAAAKLRVDTLNQTVATLEKKINGLGVAEASVQTRGGSEGETDVVVQLPGVDDPARVRGILQTSALLELAEVKGGPYRSRDEAMTQNRGVIPLGDRLGRQSSRSDTRETWWLLARTAVVTGRDLRNAQAQMNPANSSWETNFVLTQEAAERFERFTANNIGRQLAIVLDHVVLSAPTIEGRISDNGVISNVGSQEDAMDLALNLRAGSLPAGVKLTEERTVGASLGADSIRRGLAAGLLGLILVVASMVGYYRGAGWNAVLALLLNTIATVAALSYIDATWTLPGIAGLVLSIGMAVDSNVLIFERIKEEMKSGKTISAAIAAGFDRAFITIVDTHVTTVVASAFLFVFGTGPVRGFAVTLVIGLVANLFTAVFVSRVIFDTKLWRKPRLSTLSIGKEVFENARVDFLSKRTVTFGISLAAMLISAGSLVHKGGPRYGLDFRGGTEMIVRFDPKPPIEDVRGTLAARLRDVSVQEATQSTGEFIIGTGIAEETTLEQAQHSVEAALREKYSDVGEKLDLNIATQAELTDLLRRSLTTANTGVREEALGELVTRVLNYRDRECSGVVRDLEDISTVEGVDGRVMEVLRTETGLGSFNIRSASLVGPRAGEQLRRQALLATLSALGGMLIYIAFRFRLISGVAAVLATIHDVVITLGMFSLTNREVDLTIIAALLTLIGYSMNDKIVVFDRVRENMRGVKKGTAFKDLVNLSVNQTLSRTLLTAGPTLLACVALYFLGGDVLNGIAFSLLVGIVVGTYSSIFVASALLVMWENRKTRRPLGAGSV